MRTYIPCEKLKSYIQSFAISEPGEETAYKVLPGTGLVIGFQYKGRISLLDNGQQQPLSTSGVTGLHDRVRFFKSESNTGSVLVYFKEAAGSVFFKQPIHELFSESVSLDNFLIRSELLVTEELLNEAKTEIEKIKVVENFLITRMLPVNVDPMVLAALAIIHKTNGTIRIKDLARQLYTSQSPLEKKFRQAVGTSPKKFAIIVRLKHVIQEYNKAHSLTSLSYDAGFYDQAHFIKEFKDFTGETPESFFSTK